MNEPTQEQIKRFWEWCGLYKDLATDGEHHWFRGEEIVSPVDNNYDPIIDLNNLFLWAMPQLSSKMAKYKVMYLLKDWVEAVTIDDKDPALALFWVLDKVRDIQAG